MNYKKIIIFFGPPGSGKDTQAKKISDKFNIPLISTGEILRQKSKKQDDFAKKIRSIISKGRLVATETVELLLDQRLTKNDTKQGFILDGYPRNKVQLKHLKKKLRKVKKEESTVVLAVYINVSDRKVKERLEGRRICSKCGHTYHIKYNPPARPGYCDICGGELYQRKDDNLKVIEERLKIYHKRIDPLLEYFRDNEKLIKINGNPLIKEVAKEVFKKIKIYFSKL